VERLFRPMQRMLKLVREMDDVPEGWILQGLDRAVRTRLLCNFLVFQSMPGTAGRSRSVSGHADSSVERAAGARAVLADITCDSDGKIDQFIDLRDVR